MTSPVLDPEVLSELKTDLKRAWVPEDRANARDLVKPLLRGHLHQWSVLGGLATAIVLVCIASGTLATLGVVVWGVGTLLMFGTSALYHRVTWSPRPRKVMKRLDHSMIFVFIAGTYTPFIFTVIHGSSRWVLFGVVWGGAITGIVTRMLWLTAPRFLTITLYIALGWVAVFVVPDIGRGAGAASLTLLLVGGLLYTGGAVVYAARRPDPFPAVFGYHEIFHAATVLAYACHAVAIYLAVL